MPLPGQTGIMFSCPLIRLLPNLWTWYFNKNLAVTNRPRVSCAHNTSGASTGLITGRCAVELYHAPHLWYPPFTPLSWVPVLSNIEPPALRKKAATDKLVEKIVKRDSWPFQPDILSPLLLRLTSRKPQWLDLQPVDIKSRWRHNWKSAQVVNSHLPYYL